MEELIQRRATDADIPAPGVLVDCSITDTLAAIPTLEQITASRRLMGIGHFKDDRDGAPVPLVRLGKPLDDGATVARGD